MHSLTALDVYCSEETAASIKRRIQTNVYEEFVPFLALFSDERERFQRFKCLGWPDSFGLTDWTSRRRTQQRKTGKCQERLTKHIPQRLPFKSKTGRESNTHTHTQEAERERFPIIHFDASHCNNLWHVHLWINIHVAAQYIKWDDYNMIQGVKRLIPWAATTFILPVDKLKSAVKRFEG